MTDDKKYNIRFTKYELMILNDILYKKISDGGRVSEMKLCVELFDVILDILKEIN